MISRYPKIRLYEFLVIFKMRIEHLISQKAHILFDNNRIITNFLNNLGKKRKIIMKY